MVSAAERQQPPRIAIACSDAREVLVVFLIQTVSQCFLLLGPLLKRGLPLKAV
jgi:hypothetical protein